MRNIPYIAIAILFMGAECDSKNYSEQSSIVGKENNKTLYITRHAKSDWDDSSLTDFERPLKSRGEKDATMIGKILHSKDVHPYLIISSPAKRAISTAHILAGEIKYPIEKIVADEAIYEAATSELLEIIEQLDDKLSGIMLIGHNPSFTNLANYLADVRFDNIPTCGVVAIAFDVPEWKMIIKNSGKMIFFEYPKKHKE